MGGFAIVFLGGGLGAALRHGVNLLSARLSGKRPAEAAGAAHNLAAKVIRHRGALMPRATAAMH